MCFGINMLLKIEILSYSYTLDIKPRLILVLLTVTEHESRYFIWNHKIISIFVANIYNI